MQTVYGYAKAHSNVHLFTGRASENFCGDKLTDSFCSLGCAVLVKGGHLRTKHEAIDLFFDGREELLLNAPRVSGVKTHGTGCTYAAAIAAGLAKGLDLRESVEEAKQFVSRAIRDHFYWETKGTHALNYG